MDKEHLFNSTESEEAAPPRLRARRTLPPFSEAVKNEAEEEIETAKEAAEEEAPAENPAAATEEAALEKEEDGKEEGKGPAEAFLTEEKKTPATNDEKESFSNAANTFDWIKSFLFSLTTVIFVFTLIFRGVTVNGGSMLPTLEDREYLIISDLFYTPKTGDIVVVQSPNYKNGTEPLIKRVIATGGQTVRINFNTWQVWVDGQELNEDYVFFEANSVMNYEDMTPDLNGEAEVVVEENCIFVMGDHRNDSLDSRSDSVGQIDERYIMGRVLIRVTPFNRFGKVK